MPFSSKDLLLGMVLPAVVALVFAASTAFLSRRGDLRRILDPLAVVLGFLTGYWLLGLGPVRPRYDLEWIPYTVVLVLIPAAVPADNRTVLRRRFVPLALLTGLAGWLLVPTFETLEPSRNVHIVAWSIYTFVLSAGMLLIARADELFLRAPPPASTDQSLHRAAAGGSLLWLSLMIATLAAASGLLLLSGSASFTQISAAGMAALAGFSLAYWYSPRTSSLAGVSLVYSMLVSGMMLTGKVNSSSSIPTTSYLLLPLTPLAYGLAFPGASGKLTGKRILLILTVAAGICGLAVGLALAAEFGSESEY